MLSLGWARSCVKSRKQGNLMPWKGQTQGMWVARVQVKLSKVRGWCCLLSASGPYHRCLCKHAKRWSGFKVCCLWLCVPAPARSLCEGLFHEMFGHRVGKPFEAAHPLRLPTAAFSFLCCGTNVVMMSPKCRRTSQWQTYTLCCLQRLCAKVGGDLLSWEIRVHFLWQE